MVDYREIIRLKSADHSNTSVAASIGNCRSLVSEVWERAAYADHLAHTARSFRAMFPLV